MRGDDHPHYLFISLPKLLIYNTAFILLGESTTIVFLPVSATFTIAKETWRRKKQKVFVLKYYAIFCFSSKRCCLCLPIC